MKKQFLPKMVCLLMAAVVALSAVPLTQDIVRPVNAEVTITPFIDDGLPEEDWYR